MRLAKTLIFLVILIIAVPWYWPPETRWLFMGMPAWVVVAILISLFTSVFVALLLSEKWEQERTDDSDG